MYDEVFGVLLIATWINTLLYTLEVHQAYSYYKHFSNYDPPLIRRIVVFCLVMDALNLTAECASVYLYGVTHWGDEQYIRYQDWPIPMYVITTSTTAFVVQLFLIRRYYHLAKAPLISFVLLMLSLGSVGGAFCSSIMIIIHNDYEHRRSIIVPVTIWLSLSASTDCSIATALVIQLQRMRSGFKRSESLVRGVTYTTIQTGAATSVVALMAMSTYLRSTNDNVSAMFGFFLGCTYSLTMLHNLNKRKTLIGDMDNTSRFEGESGSLGLNLRALRVDPDNCDQPRYHLTCPGTQSSGTATTQDSLNTPKPLPPDPALLPQAAGPKRADDQVRETNYGMSTTWRSRHDGKEQL